jgi:hypothetical protein
LKKYAAPLRHPLTHNFNLLPFKPFRHSKHAIDGEMQGLHAAPDGFRARLWPSLLRPMNPQAAATMRMTSCSVEGIAGGFFSLTGKPLSILRYRTLFHSPDQGNPGPVAPNNEYTA